MRSHAAVEDERKYFTEHARRRLIVLDLSRLSAEESPQYLYQLRDLVSRQTPGRTLLLLVNVRGNRFNPETVEVMKRVSKANEPWVLATAMVGMSKLGSIIARQVYMSAGRRFEAFETVGAPKDWLAQQRAPKKT